MQVKWVPQGLAKESMEHSIRRERGKEPEKKTLSTEEEKDG